MRGAKIISRCGPRPSHLSFVLCYPSADKNSPRYQPTKGSAAASQPGLSITSCGIPGGSARARRGRRRPRRCPGVDDGVEFGAEHDPRRRRARAPRGCRLAVSYRQVGVEVTHVERAARVSVEVSPCSRRARRRPFARRRRARARRPPTWRRFQSLGDQPRLAQRAPQAQHHRRVARRRHGAEQRGAGRRAARSRYLRTNAPPNEWPTSTGGAASGRRRRARRSATCSPMRAFFCPGAGEPDVPRSETAWQSTPSVSEKSSSQFSQHHAP